MDIIYKDKKLEKYANDDKLAIKKLGTRQAGVFKRRIDDLAGCETLEDIKFLPGKFHELTNDRKGQWACSLEHPYRLIFEPQEFPIPTNTSGQYIYLEIKGIEIVEIVDYH